MKDINELIRRKEAELQQIQKDMELLRVAARLLSEESEAGAYTSRATTSSVYASPRRPAPGASEGGYAAPWDAAAKKFP